MYEIVTMDGTDTSTPTTIEPTLIIAYRELIGYVMLLLSSLDITTLFCSNVFHNQK